MTTIVGGIRSRLIHDSMYHLVLDSLEALGWFDGDRRHKPIQVIAKAVELDEEVPLNTIAIAEMPATDAPYEMGSNATTDTHVYYVDFFAQDDSLGKHVIGDIKDVLRGKFSSIGRSEPILAVYDYREFMANPPNPLVFTCDLENVMTDRANNFPHPWQRHWFTCRVNVVDSYGDEST